MAIWKSAKKERKAESAERKQTENRRLLYTCNTLLIVLIAFAAGIIINLLAARYNWRYDTTRNKLYSLSEQTRQTMAALDKKEQPLEIIAFFQEDSQNERLVQELLKEYKEQSKNLSYRFIDPYKHPAETKRYQIQQEGTLLILMGEEERKVFPGDIFSFSYYGPPQFYGEQAVTRAISKMLTGGEETLYFLQGHGEGSINDEYIALANYLKGEGYNVHEVNLPKEGEIPEDCSLLICAGPEQDLLAEEETLIRSFTAQGGRVMFLLDYTENKLPRIMSILAEWGLGAEDAIVVELERRSLFDPTTIFPNYVQHEITKELQAKEVNLVFPANRALREELGYAGQAKRFILLRSSNNSWAERNPHGQVQQDADETAGPISLAIAAQLKLEEEKETTEPENADEPLAETEEESKESRLLLFANSFFIDNSYIEQGGNLNLFYNAVQWLLGEEEKITILPKQTQLTQVSIPAGQGLFIRWFSMGILPLIILCLGGFIWIRRRRK